MRIFVLLTLCLGFSFSQASVKNTSFIKVNGVHFERGGKPYYYVGTNFWYGANLGMPGKEGDRPRLLRELDRLQLMGVNNLRIIAGSEGPAQAPYRIQPALQDQPGIYSEAWLQGLDFLLSEMSKRQMVAVVCLNNFWHWSGGMAQYLNWVGAGEIPYPPPHPGGTWDHFQSYVSQFYTNTQALELSNRFVKMVVSRTNTITGVKYREEPAIMSWQLANEPRGMREKEAYNRWIENTSDMIRSLDKNHLITTGSEGETPWPSYTGIEFVKNHAFKNIDYATLHIWVQNWRWYDPADHNGTYSSAVKKMKDYLKTHVLYGKKLQKPVVLEEFGISRDKGEFSPLQPVTVRDQYYQTVFEEVFQTARKGTALAGVNFWAWAGEARPALPGGLWRLGDAFIGDPPHEPQGWYSVYNADVSTSQIIHKYAQLMSDLHVENSGDSSSDDSSEEKD